MNRNTYFIGGIATDARLYEYALAHIPGSIYLPFPKHAATDTMISYAKKFVPLIDTTKPFNIVANSMGGIMAMELVKHVHPEKIVLISSVKSRKEMPLWLRQLKYSKLHRLVSGKMFIDGVRLGSGFIPEINSEPGLRNTVVEMAQNNSPEFLRWCVNAIINWNGDQDYPKNTIHIHGTKDRMFPIKNIKDVIAVKDGSHNMLLTRKEEITALIAVALNARH